MIITSPEFKKSFFQWALNEARSEVGRGCPLLRTIESRTARKLVAFINTISEVDRSDLIDYSVSKAFGFAELSRGSYIFDEAARMILEPSPQDYFGTKVGKGSLRRAVLRRLAREIGAKPERFSPSEVVFPRRIGQCDVLTIVDFGGSSQMRYGHKISNEKSSLIADFIDIQAWMGFGHAKWNEISDIGRACDSVATICMRFLGAVPDLLPQK